MFEAIEKAARDAILGLTEEFENDPNPNKINLGVGVYANGEGRTPIFESVKEAERRILDRETTKTYVGIGGSVRYASAVQELLFGADHEVIAAQRVVTVQTPGGTGALRIAAEFVKRMLPGKRMHLPDPTWANHPNVMQAASLETRTYPYFDAETNSLNFDAMLTGLGAIPEGDVVLLHACCQNPTGVDPSVEQWKRIADVVHQRKLLPLVDFAYQGLAAGLSEDAAGLLELMQTGSELMVANSFSKNFGLYCERIGALSVLAKTPESADAVLSQLKKIIRANYSNPPEHGAAVVTTILSDPQLRTQWEQEVTRMRERIHKMRRMLVDALKQAGIERDFSFIAQQNGMFSYTGLTREQVLDLREKHSIYIVDSSRINVAALTESNIPTLARAIASVL